MGKKNAVSACEVIRKDHDGIKSLLKKFDTAGSDKEKETIVQELGAQLTEHSRVGEMIMFPAAAKMAGENSFVDELKESDNCVKMHLAQVQRLYADVDKEEFNKKMGELKEAVVTLIDKEESSLIPCMSNTEYDLDSLGEEVEKLRAGESIEPIKLRKRA